MTELLEKAFAIVRTLPTEAQDDLAQMLIAFAEEGSVRGVVTLTPDEVADLVEAEAQADRGDFATDAEMQAIFAKYGS